MLCHYSKIAKLYYLLPLLRLSSWFYFLNLMFLIYVARKSLSELAKNNKNSTTKYNMATGMLKLLIYKLKCGWLSTQQFN